MPRNVVRLLQQPCAKPQWRTTTIPSRPLLSRISRTYASSAASQEEQPTQDEHEPLTEDDGPLIEADEIHQIRVLDQRSIRDTKVQLSNLTAHVHKMNTHIAQIPLQITDPNISVPYHLGFLHQKLTTYIPEAADRVLKSVERVQLNLTDLQCEPYYDADSTNSKNNGKQNVRKSDLAAWERLIDTWTDEEKEEKLREMVEFEQPAMLEQNEARVAKVLAHAENYLDEVRAREGKPPLEGRERKANPFSTSPKSEDGGKDSNTVEVAQSTAMATKTKEKERKKESAPAAETEKPKTSLLEIGAALMKRVGQ